MVGVRDRLEVALSWLGDKLPQAPCGISWGVPWQRGQLRASDELKLLSEASVPVPVQTWPLASWPDGSLKWTGHAAVLGPEHGRQLRLVTADDERGGAVEGGGLTVSEGAGCVIVNTGRLCCEISRKDGPLVRELSTDGRLACSGLRLVAERERRRSTPFGEERTRTRGHGVVSSLVIEQRGRERCVVRAAGAHVLQETSGTANWLPFVVRLYFYRDSARVRVVHTVVVDADPAIDFPSGIGLECSVPLRGAAYNRHAAAGGETGFFSEPAQLLWTWRAKDADGLYRRQIEGLAVDLDGPGHARLLELLEGQAIWQSFKLVQGSADHFSISKRTRQGCAWVHAGDGSRANGIAGLWGDLGGLAVGIGDFWQKAPRSLELDGVTNDNAILRAWLWSPDVEAMDLRHYDTETHVQAAYEGFDEMRADPRGIANTNEIWFEPLAPGPQHQALGTLAQDCPEPPLLVCEPSWYHKSGVFGVWSLPCQESPASRWLEARLKAALDFYGKEVEQRRWYGFWDYGDFMHSYDSVRHCWRYDLGGYAWQNTELVPNLWLWYSFLRTGRRDVFRLAAAMTRHTSEVDVYHAGVYEGLGSRHNVRHWGCGCKEARISMAGLHRPFFYLTTDERVGEVIAQVAANVEASLLRVDPARTLVAKDRWPTHVRTGPDWAALCSDWLTDWERNANSASRTAIETGVASLKRAPLRMASGPVFGYDPETRRLEHIGDDNYSYHMVAPFGGAEIWMELSALLPGSGLCEMLCELAMYAVMSPEERKAVSGGVLEVENWSQTWFYARLVAFAAAQKHDESLASKAWEMFLGERAGLQLDFDTEPVPDGEAPRPLEEIPWVSTNAVSQWSLNAIECLELAPGALQKAWEQARRDVAEGARR